MAVLSVRALHKSYGAQPVLAGIDFDIQPGECFGLLGPNGAGKTTTLKLCLGLTEPESGTIELMGHAVPQHAREARHHVGVVPQFDNLDPDFSVIENLMVYGRYFGLDDAVLRPRIPGLLEFAGLTARGNTRIQTLSGGMKRRLTLARSLINDPQLILMDEPTTGLDPQARHVIWERLRQLLAQGKTILLTTHFMEEAERLCTRLVIMDHGRLIAEGSPRALIAEHIEPHVVEVYGEGADDWAEGVAARHCERVERSGESFFCYARHAKHLLADLDERPALTYMHRHANLEDVFLKLTGRELRD